MKLKNFTVKSYRSIKEAKLTNLQNYCVITGPNNAGKSNLLRAMYVALSIAMNGTFRSIRRNKSSYNLGVGSEYQWEQDIPVSLKNDETSATEFELSFSLSDEEKKDFKAFFGVRLSTDLRMKFTLSKSCSECHIILKGRAKKPLEEKWKDISEFVQRKLAFEYIPCVRSSDFTAEYFSRLITKELEQLESIPEYKECLDKIAELQAPIIENLEKKITQSLQTFLPNVVSVKLDDSYSKIDTIARRPILRARQMPISIDDGTMTSIENKGDGIKSLAAISIIQSMTFEKAGNRPLILLIEEPEAHLHPNAIHSLRNVINEIASTNGVQVLISTHSPILLDRNVLSNNIIVYDDHQVDICKSVESIRRELGIRTLDALLPEKVIIVEGESDQIYLETLCKELNNKLKGQIESGKIVFKSADSATKIDNLIRYYDSLMIPSFAVFDSDACGKEAYENILRIKLKSQNEIAIIKGNGMEYSEIEDWVSFDAYFDIVKEKYNIYLDNDRFKKRKSPWSDRLKAAAKSSPGMFDKEIERKIKIILTDIVSSRGMEAIADYEKESVKKMVDCISTFANN